MMNGWLHKSKCRTARRRPRRITGLLQAPAGVLAEHGNSIRILHTLTPVGVAMAGENEFDPYKD